MDFSKIKEVPVVVYGSLEQYNEVLSKGRCRIFYKYMNRNGTYITDEFAEKLISTLPYAPVKGIYDEFNEDYTSHGKRRDEGRIYGIVPADPNFSWEKHLDEDGVEREYACVDVLLFTGIYKEASQIVGKAQSMEIYEPSIKGEWMTIEGRRAFVFTDGCFLGLQVLGDETEPCFEGAAFFSLYKSLSEIIEKLDTYEKNLNNPESNEGGYKMPTINFRLSDDDKGCKLFDLLNPNYNEEGSWDLDCIIQDVYDDYAVVWNIKEQCHERVYYSKDDEAEEVTLGEKVKCFIVDVTEDEKKALKTIQALNGGTYEKIDENFGLVAEFNEKIAEDGQKIEELNASISTLESERNESIEQFEKANEQIEALTTEVAALNEYKLQVETSEKEAVINKYSKRVNEEVLDSYREKIAEFTAVELDKELAFELVNTNPSIFELDSRSEDIIPKNTPAKSAMETLLDRYEK
jgi:hypothetical protein